MELPRTAIITGAGRGIGVGLVNRLHAQGYQIGMMGRTPETMEVVADELGLPRPVVAVADVIDPHQVAEAVGQITSRLGPIGLLINNAGVIEQSETDLLADDLDETWRVITVNVKGPIVVTKAVLPGMLAYGGGRIINVTSGSAYSSQIAYTGYGMSKAAVSRLSWALHCQYHESGIRVLDLAPGVVATDMTAGMPLHHHRTIWTGIDEVGDLVSAFGAGLLDGLSGRYVRAGTDTATALRNVADIISSTDARRLRVPGYGVADRLG